MLMPKHEGTHAFLRHRTKARNRQLACPYSFFRTTVKESVGWSLTNIVLRKHIEQATSFTEANL